MMFKINTTLLNLARTSGLLLSLATMFFFYVATAQAGQVTLAWGANTQPNLGGYKVYYGTASRNYSANVDVGNQTTYTVPNLDEGKTYYFAVTDYDAAYTTESTFSNEVSTTIYTAGSLPSPWLDMDVGNIGLPGSAGYANGTFAVKGSGVDIWGSQDAFHFVYQPLTGNGTIVARVGSIINTTSSWAKAGVMIRESLDATARHAMVVVTPGSGVAFQSRATTGGSSSYTAGATVTAPYWVKLVRAGNTFTAYQSVDGSNWTQIGSATISMVSSVYIGLTVTSHDNSVLSAGTLDNVNVHNDTTPPVANFSASSTSGTAPLTVTFTDNSTGDVTARYWDFGDGTISPDKNPVHTYTAVGTYTVSLTVTGYAGNNTKTQTSFITVMNPWLDMDIGSVGLAGSVSYANGTFTVKGSGADIWGGQDAFHFVYQPLNGNGTIVARVGSITNTNSWAKAGVMIRESLNATARYAMVVVTPGSGVAFQSRATTGGSFSYTAGATVTAPYWVKLVRAGTTFTAYQSVDGSTWTQIGSAIISMATTAYVGLALTSHNYGVLCTAILDNVSIK